MDIVFATWIINANIWFAASHATKEYSSRVFCNLVGAVWLLIAIVKLWTLEG